MILHACIAYIHTCQSNCMVSVPAIHFQQVRIQQKVLPNQGAHPIQYPGIHYIVRVAETAVHLLVGQGASVLKRQHLLHEVTADS